MKEFLTCCCSFLISLNSIFGCNIEPLATDDGGSGDVNDATIDATVDAFAAEVVVEVEVVGVPEKDEVTDDGEMDPPV